jgi:quercetin dioxygenase-like cupin family protein
MKIYKIGSEGIAIIDPHKKMGEKGQYNFFKEDQISEEIISQARKDGLEIRYYNRNIKTVNGEMVPIKIIVTEIPPGHVQPFHTHQKIHEATTVIEGSITVIDSNEIKTEDKKRIENEGVVLNKWETVVEDPEIRHTVANLSQKYATMYTIQSARIPFEEFKEDWIG